MAAVDRPSRAPLTHLVRAGQDPETVLPEVTAEMQAEAIGRPWRGRGKVIAAAGVLFVDMVVRR